MNDPNWPITRFGVDLSLAVQPNKAVVGGVTVVRPNLQNAPDTITGLDFAIVDNVTQLAALTDAFSAVFLRGYHWPSDGGGGWLIYHATATSRIDNGLVFDGPGSVGRWLRPYTGFIHSRWFGLTGSTTVNQAEQFQNFCWVICTPGYGYVISRVNGTAQTFGGFGLVRGIIDPGVIDCNGATVYLERDGLNEGTGIYANSAQLIGANRRFSILRNVNFVIGTPRWKSSTASGNLVIRDFRLEGRFHVQNIENNSEVSNISILRAPLDTEASPMNPDFPTDLGHNEPVTGQSWFDWAEDHMMTTVVSNHPRYVNLYVNGKEGSGIGLGHYRKGIKIQADVNNQFAQGQVFGCDPGVEINGAGAADITFDQMKFEECEGRHIWVKAGFGHKINTWHRQGEGHGVPHGGVHRPLITLGEAGVSTPQDISIEATLFTTLPQEGTAIRIEQCSRALITRNTRLASTAGDGFLTGIEVVANSATLGAGRTVQDIVIQKGINYTGTTTPIDQGARTHLQGDQEAATFVIPTAAAVIWSGFSGTDQLLTTSANTTISVGEMTVAGSINQLTIEKGADAHTITWAGTTLNWDGGVAPDLNAMTAAQWAIITVTVQDMGAGAVLLASGKIFG